ncbi:MAG: hypothetical protein U0271_15040 [Polyangiaceae bacterium]
MLPAPFAGTRAAHADEAPLSQGTRVAGSDFKVGDVLEALDDVSLDEAVVAKGSKVSVSGKRRALNKVMFDVALADGHVVKGVPLADIAKNFRRVAD